MPRLRAPRPSGTLRWLTPLLLVTTACSVLLDPERHDDVARCDHDDDCPPAEDPRYRLVCTVSEEYEGEDIDFSRICAPRTATSCNPRDYPFDSTLATRHREATGVQGRYDEHCSEQPGIQGCLPLDGECLGDLTPHEASGRCDDLDPLTPPAVAAEPSVTGQDVLDQFCRAVYCNAEFACSTKDFVCIPCTLGRALGAGGCGDLFLGGEASSVYQTAQQLEEQCEGAQLDFNEVFLGAVEPSA